MAALRFAFNHAGDLLASGGWEGVLRLWDPRTGKQLFSTPSWGELPRFSPDDRLLAQRCPQTASWGHGKLPAGGEYRTLVARRGRRPGTAIIMPAIRSDGRLLAVGMDDGVGLWDLHEWQGASVPRLARHRFCLV